MLVLDGSSKGNHSIYHGGKPAGGNLALYEWRNLPADSDRLHSDSLWIYGSIDETSLRQRAADGNCRQFKANPGISRYSGTGAAHPAGSSKIQRIFF